MVDGCLGLGAGRFGGLLAGSDGGFGGDGVLSERSRFAGAMSLGCFYDFLAGIARCHW